MVKKPHPDTPLILALIALALSGWGVAGTGWGAASSTQVQSAYDDGYVVGYNAGFMQAKLPGGKRNLCTWAALVNCDPDDRQRIRDRLNDRSIKIIPMEN